jgi:NodT family efflux transporter outer membrane factor (OMF) lipoprotein
VRVPKKFSASGETAADPTWWTAFNDKALNALVERAVADNFDLRAAWDRLAQARAVARKAQAPLYPSVTGEGGVSRTRTVELVEETVAAEAPSRTGGALAGADRAGDAAAVGGTAPATETTTRTHRETAHASDVSLGLVASYELDVWGRLRAARNAAALAAQASAEDVAATAITLAAEVAATWYRLVDQRGQLALLDEQIETNEKYLELLTLRFRRGQVPATDVLQQEQLLEATRAEKALAEAQRDVLVHQLAILLGQPPRERVSADEENLPELPPLPKTGLPANLIRQRPDVRSAALRLQAARQDVAEAVADRFPRISLSARAETSGPGTRELFENWLTSLAANLSAPLMDGGLRRAEVDRTRAAAAERLHAYGQEILTALGEVEDALAQERRQVEYVASLARQLELSRKAMEQTRERYAKGAEDFLRVLTAIQSYQDLQRRHREARRQLLEFRIDLYRALGGGWDMDAPGPSDENPERDTP